jgi:hypoxanthine phosphoribosyltransferase
MTLPNAQLLLDEAALDAITTQLAEALDAESDTELTVAAVMDGALWLAADLLRKLRRPVRLMTIRARSYDGRANGQVELLWAPSPKMLAGRDVLILDDILDTGQTLSVLADELALRGARRVRTCVLLRKARPDLPHRPAVDFFGADIPDVFVAGYGLDDDGLYRNLPAIYALPESGA